MIYKITKIPWPINDQDPMVYKMTQIQWSKIWPRSNDLSNDQDPMVYKRTKIQWSIKGPRLNDLLIQMAKIQWSIKWPWPWQVQLINWRLTPVVQLQTFLAQPCFFFTCRAIIAITFFSGGSFLLWWWLLELCIKLTWAWLPLWPYKHYIQNTENVNLLLCCKFSP